MPTKYKIRRSCLKYLLRKLALNYLPAELVKRRKQGFGVPLGSWFRGELRELLQDNLGSSLLAADGFLKPKELHKLLAEHLSGRVNYGRLLFTLLMGELWYRRNR